MNVAVNRRFGVLGNSYRHWHLGMRGGEVSGSGYAQGVGGVASSLIGL